MRDILCVGNALVDAMLSLRDAHRYVRLDETTHELCFRSGQKIPLKTYSLQLGGNACNVSVGLSRLGFSSGLSASLGQDVFADKILGDLTADCVDVTHVNKEEGPTSFAVVLNYKDERTLFTNHVERTHRISFENISVRYMYLSSLGREWRPTYEKSLRFVQEKKIPLFFNPGTPQLEEGMESFAQVLPAAQILFLNKDEAERMLEVQKTTIKTLLEKLQALGPKNVVVTDGTRGSYALSETSEFFSLGITDAPIVERTGAGDAYTTGFIAAVLQGKSVSEAMQWGTVNAASVVGMVGAQPGLLSKNELAKRLETVSFSQATEQV